MNLIGKQIGSYQIVEELGRGGMAVVYRAYQPSLNRHVAIKVLPPQLGFDRQFVDRFLREARAAASLRHPNIVVIHDVGHETGQEQDIYFIVMEYLEGHTLKDLVQQEGPLHPQRAAYIVEQVASALDYAHQRGFVHRDVKPANIFVGPGDHVTLTDFGIAKAASETQHLTRTGTLMGTPEYMSPEQASGGEVDHRTDLYALGVVLYQVLVGHVPFRGTTPHAVLHNVIYEPPLAPRQVNPNLSPALEGVILKAIAKQPEQRFQRGAEMSRAVRQALSGVAPAGARLPPAPPPPVPRGGDLPAARRGPSPLPWILAGIAAVLVLIIGGLLLVLAGGDDGPPLPATATQALAQNSPTAGAVEATAAVGSTPTPEAQATAEAPTGAPTAALPTGTAVPPSDTPAPEAPTDTPVPPTNTPLPPTDTPTPTITPTPACSLAVDPELAAAWDRSLLGCPTAASSITWAAWEAFERGAMFWRQDTDTVRVLYYQGGTNSSAGQWTEILQPWDGSDPEGVGLTPPPGLFEPKRGFGWVWRTMIGGPDGQLGWAREEEKGFCAKVQPLENGLLFHSSGVEYCQDELYNWATNPSFAPLSFAFYGNGTWRRY